MLETALAQSPERGEWLCVWLRDWTQEQGRCWKGPGKKRVNKAIMLQFLGSTQPVRGLFCRDLHGQLGLRTKKQWHRCDDK